MKYYLKTPAFIDPRWFQQAKGRIETVVVHNGVDVCGQLLRFDGDHPEVGTPVVVTIGYRVEYRTKADIAATEQAYRNKQEQERQIERAKRNKRRAEAEAANALIQLPVYWTAGIKNVLSGLSATSWGDGRKANTVQHIYLLEPLHIGRIHRNQCDFLCTSASGTNGKLWSSVEEKWFDGDGKEYVAPVTCKQCLKIAKSISNASKPA